MRPGRTLATYALAAAMTLPAVGGALAVGEPELRPAGSFAGAILAARTAERDADYNVAVKFLREAIGFAEDGDLNLDQALLRALLFSGNFEDAVQTAQMLEDAGNVTSDPQNVILLTLVIDALRTREYNRAVQQLDVEGVNDLDNLLFAGLLSWARAGLEDREGAIEALSEASEGPSWVKFYANYNLGMIEEHLGNDGAARDAYTAALAEEALGGQLRDTYTRVAAALASLEARAGDNEAARNVIASAVGIAGGDPLLDFISEAMDDGEPVPPHVANAADGAGELLFGLGMALTGSRAGDLARNYLQFSRALSPQSGAALIGLAQIEETEGRAEAAIEFYDEVPENSPLRDVADLQRGLNLADLDMLDEARGQLRSAYEERPQDTRLVLALGNTLARAEDWAESAKLYDDAIQRIGQPDGDDWIIFYRRGIANERLKRWEQAEADFLKALDLRPDHPAVLNYLGYSWIDMGENLDEGLEMIRKAVSIQPNSGAYIDSLGWAYYRLGRFDEAVVELERALTLENSDPVIHDHLGDAYWRVGREREARFQWGHALKMDLERDDRRRIRRKLGNGLEPNAGTPASPDATDGNDDRA